MTDQPNTSPDPEVRTEPLPADGHALPREEWEQVVADAERIHAERAAEGGGGAGAGEPMGITPIYLDYPNDYGKTTQTIRPVQLYVIHTGETPLRVGYAQSLTNWAAKAGDPQVSWHRFIDPATVCRWVSLKKRAWHATKANPLSYAYEQSGYASYARDVWLGPDGRRQIDLLAQQIVKDGIPVSGVRILTQAQVDAILAGRDTTTVGICTHAQINPESRTDPGKGYPLDVLIEWIAHYHPEHSNTNPPEVDMPLSKDDVIRIWREDIIPSPIGNPANPTWQPDSVIVGTYKLSKQILDIVSRIDPTALADAIAKAVVEALPDGASTSRADIEAALRSVLGSLDEPTQ